MSIYDIFFYWILCFCYSSTSEQKKYVIRWSKERRYYLSVKYESYRTLEKVTNTRKWKKNQRIKNYMKKKILMKRNKNKYWNIHVLDVMHSKLNRLVLPIPLCIIWRRSYVLKYAGLTTELHSAVKNKATYEYLGWHLEWFFWCLKIAHHVVLFLYYFRIHCTHFPRRTHHGWYSFAMERTHLHDSEIVNSVMTQKGACNGEQKMTT